MYKKSSIPLQTSLSSSQSPHSHSQATLSSLQQHPSRVLSRSLEKELPNRFHREISSVLMFLCSCTSSHAARHFYHSNINTNFSIVMNLTSKFEISRFVTSDPINGTVLKKFSDSWIPAVILKVC